MLVYIIAIYLITVLVSLIAFSFIITYYVYNTMIGMYQQEKKIRFKRSELFDKTIPRKMAYCFIPVANVIITVVRIVNCDKDIEEELKYLLNERKK